MKRFAELVTDRAVERFLARMFQRKTPIHSIFIISPFISSLSQSVYSLLDIRKLVERQFIPTYIVTREPTDPFQIEAMDILLGSPQIEIRYNPCIHAKLYMVHAERNADTFALFGSGNLTTKSIESNIELAMIVYSEGPGRDILNELYYWASVRLRIQSQSKLIQSIHPRRR